MMYLKRRKRCRDWCWKQVLLHALRTWCCFAVEVEGKVERQMMLEVLHMENTHDSLVAMRTRNYNELRGRMQLE